MKDADRNRVERAQLIKSITEDWVAHLEWTALDARMRRAKYLALIKEGFTEPQALELVRM